MFEYWLKTPLKTPILVNLFISNLDISSSPEKKKFEDTTAGSIFGGLLALGNTFLKSKELDVRKDEAQAVTAISSQPIKKPSPTPEKSNTGLYVGLGVASLAVVGVLIYLKTKKK